jgi:hypothetical protein
MKRFLIIGSLSAIVAVLSSFESNASQVVIKKADLSAFAEYPVLATYAPADIAFIVAGNFSPKFESNFVRLFLFPELGSSAVAAGITARPRGPPKRQRHTINDPVLKISLMARTS